jgi:hypothetical protein
LLLVAAVLGPAEKPADLSTRAGAVVLGGYLAFRFQDRQWARLEL